MHSFCGQPACALKSLTVVLILTTHIAPAAIFYVDANKSNDGGSGLSWAAAKKTLQAAIDLTASGDEVWVKMGTYNEPRPGDADGSVVLRAGVGLYGGFAGTENTRSQRNWGLYATVISGINGRATNAKAFHVVKGANGAILDGFTVRDGNAALGGDAMGGGLSAWDVPHMTVANCRFVYNHAVVGGAIMVGPDANSITISNCYFLYNSADDSAGAIQAQPFCSTFITNSVFAYNSCPAGEHGGGAIRVHYDQGSIVNCTIYGNVAARGGGVRGAIQVVNSILWGNVPDQGAADWGTPAIDYSNVQGGYAGTGNIDADPLFVDTGAGDFRLQLTSPCIDVANAAVAPPFDMVGTPRPIDVPYAGGSGADSYDMGAFEYGEQASGAPAVTGATPTNDTTPTWSWSAAQPGATYFRYQLNSIDGSWTETAATSYTPATALPDGEHVLYVQERVGDGAWSYPGYRIITVDATPPAITVARISTILTQPRLRGAVTDMLQVTEVRVTVGGTTHTAELTLDTWRVDVTVALAPGTYDVQVQARDSVGNVGHDATTNELTIVDTGPDPNPDVEFSFDRMWPTLQQPWYFTFPQGIAADTNDHLYISDLAQGCILKFNRDGQHITTYKWRDFPESINFDGPRGLTVDGEGNIYVAEAYNHRVTKLSSEGEILAEIGPTLGLVSPFGVTTDLAGDLYIADMGSNRVLKVTSSGDLVYTLQDIAWPLSVAVDSAGFLYVLGWGGMAKYSPEGVAIPEWAQSLGTSFSQPNHVSIDQHDNLLIADTLGGRFVKLNPDGQVLGEWRRDDAPGTPGFSYPVSSATDSTGTMYFVYNDMYEYGWGNDTQRPGVRTVSADGQILSDWRAMGAGPEFYSTPQGLDVSADGTVYVADTYNHRIKKLDSTGQVIELLGSWGGSPDFRQPFDVAVTGVGDFYVSENLGMRVSKFDAENNLLFVLSGGGGGSFGRLGHIALDTAQNLYVTDPWNARIVKFSPEGAYLAEFYDDFYWNGVFGVAVDSAGMIYATEFMPGGQYARVHKLAPDGTRMDLWGQYGHRPGEFAQPFGVSVDRHDRVYVTDTVNDRIQVFTTGGELLRIIGSRGFAPGQFTSPYDVAIDALGNLHVADTMNGRVQRLRPLVFASQAKAIVLAAGGAFAGNNLWDATQLCANFAYRTLTYQGFTKETIHYLSSNTQLDLDGNGVADDVDADATNAQLQAALGWAGTGGTEDVVVYLVDHGGDGTFRMSATETLSAGQLDEWLDTLNALIPGTLTVVYEACQSGSFAAALAPTGGQKRIVVTSTDLGENAYFLSQGTISFSIFFWTHIFNGANVTDAFNLARQALTQAVSAQNPVMIQSSGLGTTFIGNGTEIEGEAPVIGGVSAAHAINGTSTATLWAGPVTDADGIARVWAVLRPPNFQTASPDNPVQELPAFDLQPTGGNRYEASYEGFTTPGLYQVAIYARDRIGNTSLPRLTTVSVQSPIRRKAILIGGGAQPDPMWPSYENALLRAYNALKIQGYTDSTIALRSPVTFHAGVDGAPSLANLQYLITTWGTYETYDLVVYYVGPGSSTGLALNAAESVTPGQLDTWADAAQHSVPGVVTLLLDSTGSGGFLPELVPPQGKPRIGLASARPAEAARFLSGGDLSFSSYFWNGVLNGANVNNAFKQGQSAMRFSGFGQLAGLDDNANGVANEKSEGALSRTHYIGAGIKLAGDDPVIGSAGATPSPLTAGTTATLWVEDVTTTGTIASVMATITPPRGGTPVEVPLSPVGNGRYQAVYGGFTLYGDYGLHFMAVDTAGNSSLPASALLKQLNGADPYEPDSTLAQATETGIFGEITRHNFHIAGDADWLRFWGQAGNTLTLETLHLEANCDSEIALFHANGSPVMVNGEAVVDDDGSLNEPLASYYLFTPTQSAWYFLRVRYAPLGEGTGYGLGTGYDVRVSHEVVGCTASASLTVYVRSGNTKIQGATVNIARGGYTISATTDAQGEATFPTLSEQGSYSLQVTKTGYQTFNDSAIIECGTVYSADATLTSSTPGVKLELSQSSLDFGEVAVNATRSLSLTISNTGTGTLSGSATLSGSGMFSVFGGNTYSLGAGQSKTLTLRYSPTATGGHNATIGFSGMSGAPGVPLTGRGFAAGSGIIGDVNSDGQISALDATLISLYLLVGEASLNAQLTSLGLNPFQARLANVDGSGNSVTAYDATLINLQQLMGQQQLNQYLISLTPPQPTSKAGMPAE